MFAGRLAIQQRVLPTYRAAFFDMLAEACAGGLSVCAGQPRPQESIAVTQALQKAHYFPAENIHLLRGTFYFCYQRGLLHWLEQVQPDALILEANPRYLANGAAVRWMKRRGKPVLGWGLGAPATSRFLRLSGGLGQTQRRAFLRPFDGLLTYSRQGAEEFAALGFPSEKIFVAPNAAAKRPVEPLPEKAPGFAGAPNVLFVGRLQKRKRLDLLLQACAALPEELRPHLTVVGDGPEREALQALAKEVYPAAEFSGAKHGAELAQFFTRADLFVLPGTGGLAVQEAMSYGLPVIMGQGDGTNDDLVRPGNGWQIPPDDFETLKGTLEQALSDPARLRAMGMESYRIVRDEINLEKMVDAFVGAVNKVERG